jgi:hypothetical protein
LIKRRLFQQMLAASAEPERPVQDPTPKLSSRQLAPQPLEQLLRRLQL